MNLKAHAALTPPIAKLTPSIFVILTPPFGPTFRRSERPAKPGITPDHLRIDEPAAIRGKGRPKGSLNKKKQQAFDNSTRRLPSQFELAEAHAQEHVWSQGGTQASVQVPNSQPATQRGRGQQGGRAQRGGRGDRGQRGDGGSVPGVPSHMTSTIQF